MKENLKIKFSSDRYPEQEKDIELLLENIERRPTEDKNRLLQTLKRYEVEGENNAYESDTSGLIAFIAKERLLEGSASLVDLGAGSGNLITDLAPLYPDMQFLGIDLSPSFVSNFNAEKESENARVRIGLIDSPETIGGLEALRDGSVISVLTLDRVADPRQLIKNMGAFSGSKILATLLPVNPVDDNPSIVAAGNGIEYTRKEMRVTSGADEDEQMLVTLLTEMWGAGVRVNTVPYAVKSSGDIQPYELVVFSK